MSDDIPQPPPDQPPPQQPPLPPDQPPPPPPPDQPRVVQLSAGAKPSVGDIISKSFGVYGRHFIGITLTSAVIFLPFFFYANDKLDGPLTKEALEDFQTTTSLGSLALSLLLTSIITGGTVRELDGKTVSYAATLKEGFGSLPTAIGAMFLYGIAVLAGMILLVIPGIIVMVTYYVVVPVALVERPGVGAAFRRSAELTAGWRWPLFGTIVLVFIIVAALSGVAIGIVGNGPEEQIYTSLVMQVVFTPFGAILPAVIYHELRRSQGGTLEELADVFD